MKNLLLSALLILTSIAQSQTNSNLSVFLDCNRGCDHNYIQTEIPYVNLIREPKEAKVHIIVSQNETGAGGARYTFRFIGQKEFSSVNDTLILNMKPDASEDEKRIAQVDILNKGLFTYIKHSTLAENITIQYKQKGIKPVDQNIDPWSFWVYKIRANA